MVKELIRKEIETCLKPWLNELGVVLPVYSLEEPPKQFKADLSTNISLLLSKILSKRPRKIAEDITKRIQSFTGRKTIEAVEIAGPGFINIHVTWESLYDTVRCAEERLPENQTGKKPTVLIEFVSANPTGPLHIGHGRGAALGDSLARIMTHLGYTVRTEYYVNNTGNQMETLGRSVMTRLQQLEGMAVEFPPDGYQGAYIAEIAEKIFKEKKNLAFKDVQAFAVDTILDSIREDLRSFGVSFDQWFNESDLYREDGVDRLLKKMKTRDQVYEQDGALWFRSARYGDEKDRVIKRTDGRYTYLASDIAYHAQKLKRGFDELIDIWGADHHGYINRVKGAIEALGASPERLTILLYQLVSLSRGGKPVAMSTRTGEFITLREVLDEVGTDACRFFFALRSPHSQLEFDLELAKKQTSENPVYYVQYVHARICSIFREAKKNNITPSSHPVLEKLVNPDERALMLKIAFFNDILALCVQEKTSHHITKYLLDLAALFHKFYDTCRVLTPDRELTGARLALIEAVKRVISQGLFLLGVSAPEKM